MTLTDERADWRIERADDYMHARTGRYEYRRIRYLKALGALREMGLRHSDTVVDIGAGWTELDYCLRVDGGWRGRYIPVDMGVDGTDLNTWQPPREYDFAVALEVLEHLNSPFFLVDALMGVTRGMVVSVPNPRTVDVLGMDETHVTVVTRGMLESWGFNVTEQTLYGGVWSDGEPDSLLGIWYRD